MYQQADHGFACLGRILIVFRQSAVTAKAPKGPLNNPPFRQYLKAFPRAGGKGTERRDEFVKIGTPEIGLGRKML
jgi:hypothetical protein